MPKTKNYNELKSTKNDDDERRWHETRHNDKNQADDKAAYGTDDMIEDTMTRTKQMTKQPVAQMTWDKTQWQEPSRGPSSLWHRWHKTRHNDKNQADDKVAYGTDGMRQNTMTRWQSSLWHRWHKTRHNDKNQAEDQAAYGTDDTRQDTMTRTKQRTKQLLAQHWLFESESDEREELLVVDVSVGSVRGDKHGCCDLQQVTRHAELCKTKTKQKIIKVLCASSLNGL